MLDGYFDCGGNITNRPSEIQDISEIRLPVQQIERQGTCRAGIVGSSPARVK